MGRTESQELVSLRREVQEFTRRQREWQESERDARLLLDAYKSLPKEKRQLAEVRSAELKTAEDFKKSNDRCRQVTWCCNFNSFICPNLLDSFNWRWRNYDVHAGLT